MLASIDGMPMVRRTVATLLAGGVDRCVVVVASDGASAIGAALDGLAVELVVNPDPSRGMFSSVQCGLHATGEHELCVLLPGDMPFIQPLTVTLLIAHAREASRTTAPALEGHAGHPVVLSPMMRAHILAAQAESRLDHELAHESVLLVPVADPGVRRDVDRPRIAECAR